MQIFSKYGRKCKGIAFKYTDFNSYTRVTVYAECIYVLLSKSCPHRWIPCWLLSNTAAISMGKTRYFEHGKYQHVWM